MLTDIQLSHLEHICFNLREADKIEVLSMRPHDNAYRLAWESYHLISNQGRGKVAWFGGQPAAVIAFTEMWPGCWEVWSFGTDHYRAVAADIIRYGRREAKDILNTHGGHRLQCDSRVGHDEAHKMLKALGAKPEGPPMQGYGKDGSSYQRFVWLRATDSAVLEPGFTRAA